MCSTVSLGSPAGRLQWLAGNDVIVSGGYGVTQLPFPTNSVNRTHDGMRVTCQVDWVVKQSVFVTDKVAYGPERVSLQVRSIHCLVIATCTVDDLRPFSYDMVQWGGQCQGQRGVVCTFESCDAEDVTCSVTNHANNGRSVRAVEKVTVTGSVAASDILARSVGASVGVTLGVLVLAVCLVLAVVWIRRRHSPAGRKESNNTRKHNSAEHDYAGLFQITGREITQSDSSNNESDYGSSGNAYQNVPRPRT
ncbi:uncharacterized protein LOC112569578 [Pomacea canaliculata]|uniref:uncharacterized protein LOC112569578 n=1 Tax=Pomacea canaliculata TaxID=400727 RepID=UPI000D72D7A9|nr:uncharacterized protein LOC112569578 [Pomacea canaliculata]XP_025103181.1 uncharacterized protein LOC112569578 [Pomacea canaliculata]XP_025103182.1 uncharacterized protein LOC112569578 [Pomacea canaliculata]XP_025103183.1 uncharacterized protein LOC112569578 [Pomacea canaliculata]XP_025103184.1 uncharacterized protein LOC112569578 [Pomacea canaliculata]XP_025103185.1 uncharacterized protein LOC112569578 [Pomacea canaliculata]